jgi:hypothetical protein
MVDRRDPAEPSTLAVETALPTKVDATSARFEANMRVMADLVAAVHNEEEEIRLGGGQKAIESQHG